MKTILRPGIFAFVLIAAVFLSNPQSSQAAAMTSEVVPAGGNTFSITHRATNAFSRDIDKLKASVESAAAKYCAAQGKQLKVVNLTTDKPIFSTGYPSATIIFKALNPGEVEATKDISPPASSSKQDDTGTLYNDLLKLEELRKKKILTKEEFQSEKKKVLERSK